jgi:hypothetical protein
MTNSTLIRKSRQSEFIQSQQPAFNNNLRRHLLKLFLELFELQTQAFNFTGESFDAVFKTNDFFGFGRLARLFAHRVFAV